MRGWQRAPSLGTGDASRAWPLGGIPGGTGVGDGAGGHPWIGGDPESCHRPFSAPLFTSSVPLGATPGPTRVQVAPGGTNPLLQPHGAERGTTHPAAHGCCLLLF